jgi:hypothetical protein
MNEEARGETALGGAPMPTAEAERVLVLLAATGDVHADLERVLREPRAEQIVEEIVRDEIQNRRA